VTLACLKAVILRAGCVIVIVELLIHHVLTSPVTKVVIADTHMSEVISGGHGSKDFDKRFTLM
jgi:hypothetical protein